MTGTNKQKFLKILKDASLELRELDIGSHVSCIDIADFQPLTFLKDYVSCNKPCIIRGAAKEWPACRLWCRNYLLKKLQSLPVTVDLTPNGFGDAVTEIPDGSGPSKDGFVTPLQEQMSLPEFFELLDRTRSNSEAQVPYVQHQNGNLTEEFQDLLPDLGADFLSKAQEIFGAEPDAINLWIGDDRSVTSFHKDHYENLYAVIAGTKIFTLLPPTDVYRMYMTPFPAATYVRGPAGNLEVQWLEPPQSVTWSKVDPYPVSPTMQAAMARSCPLFFDPQLPPPIRCEVQAGDVLYLPSTWFHHVAQRNCPEERCVIAVNFWFDMHFDCKYVYFKMVESLASCLRLATTSSETENVIEENQLTHKS